LTVHLRREPNHVYFTFYNIIASMEVSGAYTNPTVTTIDGCHGNGPDDKTSGVIDVWRMSFPDKERIDLKTVQRMAHPDSMQALYKGIFEYMVNMQDDKDDASLGLALDYDHNL